MKKIIILTLFLIPYFCSAFTVVHISDIHASGKKTRKNTNGSVLNPKMYKACLKIVANLGADVVVATGDYSDKGGKKYYRNTRDLMVWTNTLWVKGNHDSVKDFKILSSQSDYFVDRGNWRFIMLDSTQRFGSSTGYLSSDQISFLRSAEITDKNIIISMHHPPFWYNSRAGMYSSTKAEPFLEFFAVLTPNVKYVLTGHWHHDYDTVVNGVNYQTVKALTQDKICNYKIINLESE